MSKNLETRQILISEITVDETRNARKVYDESGIKSLAHAIKTEGLLNPVTVQVTTDEDREAGITTPYVLVAGYRRMRAHKILEATSIKATILDPDAKPLDSALINLSENLNRENLSTYEVASGCVYIRDTFGLKGEQIAARVKGMRDDDKGLSKSHVNNLMRIYTNLEESIKEEWKNRGEKATVPNLLKLLEGTEDHSDQIYAWDVFKTRGKFPWDLTEEGTDEGEREGEDEEEDNKEAAPALRARNAKDIAAAIPLVRKSEASDEWKKGAIAALEWACGKRQRIPGLAEATSDADKAKSKKAKKAAGVTAGN